MYQCLEGSRSRSNWSNRALSSSYRARSASNVWFASIRRASSVARLVLSCFNWNSSIRAFPCMAAASSAFFARSAAVLLSASVASVPGPHDGETQSLGFKSLSLRLRPRNALVLKRQLPHEELSASAQSVLALDGMPQQAHLAQQGIQRSCICVIFGLRPRGGRSTEAAENQDRSGEPPSHLPSTSTLRFYRSPFPSSIKRQGGSG